MESKSAKRLKQKHKYDQRLNEIWWSLRQFIADQVYEILFRFVQMWHFYCTMFKGVLLY